jgi:hypothetical protein
LGEVSMQRVRATRTPIKALRRNIVSRRVLDEPSCCMGIFPAPN